MSRIDTAVSPYYDDYDESKKFVKVLSVPSRAVQVRELNQTQTYIQKQIERFGSHVFENGSMVIPGEFNYNLELEYVTIGGVDFNDIAGFLSSSTVLVTGQTTGVVAKVVKSIGPENSDPITLYVQYIKAGTDSAVSKFADGEPLTLSVEGGADFSNPNAINTGRGSSFTVNEGVYYTNGYFVMNSEQTVMMDKYGIEPSVVVGFRYVESVVNYTMDSSLVDNVNNQNFNAPGADRLKVDLVLEVHQIDGNFDKTDFFQLASFRGGLLQKKARGPEYSILEETLARRTFDESGDYTVRAYPIAVREHLKDSDNPDGVYTAAQGGDESRYAVGVEAGKAYVKGFEVENFNTIFIDAPKPRTTSFVNNSTISLPVGSYVEATLMNAIPVVTGFVVASIYDDETIGSGATPSGSVIGTARVRYVHHNNTTNVSRIYLFDFKDSAGNRNTDFMANAKAIFIPGATAVTANISPEIIDSVNAKLVYSLPNKNVKTLLDISNASDTTFTFTKAYSGLTDVSGVVTFTAGSNEIFVQPSSSNASAYDGSNFVDLTSISTLGGTPVGKNITIDFGVGAATQTAVVFLSVVKQIGQHKSKTVATRVFTAVPGDWVDGILKLGKADAFKLNYVKQGTTDITNRFVLDPNKNEEYYDISLLAPTSSAYIPSSNVEISFDYFNHGNGDYFSVDSYASIPYQDIPTEVLNNETVSLGDVLDFRPRINDAGTGFTGSGSSTTEVPTPYSLLRLDTTYYLPRVDRLCVDTNGDYNIIQGVPSDEPVAPEVPSNSMCLYILSVPAYTKNAKEITFTQINNRRYTMRDIGKLDDRISNLEYYVSLNMLETETSSMQIIDPTTGLPRFKNGFAVDNFVDLSFANVMSKDYAAAIDQSNGILRPSTSSDIVDFYADLTGSTNFRLTGDVVSLPYTEISFIKQDMASGFINVNPYAIFRWNGETVLTPNQDIWYDSMWLAPDIVSVPAPGVPNQDWQLLVNRTSKVFYEHWNRNWIGLPIEGNRRGWVNNDFRFETGAVRGIVSTGNPIGTAAASVVGDRVLFETEIPYMREKEVSFSTSGMKPDSRVYPFFDNVNVSAYCKPVGGSYGDALVTDSLGELEGVFKIPNNEQMKFRTGTKIFALMDSASGNSGLSDTVSESQYTAKGAIQNKQQVVEILIGTRTTWLDPIAQSFLVDKNKGTYATSVELYFKSKDSTVPVQLQIREMENGNPTQRVVGNASVVLNPSQVNISDDASVATKFVFKEPVYLSDKTEYCFVVLSNSNNYNIFIATMGEKNLAGGSVSKQPYAGVMFKSQNNSTWTADQTSDVKFNINVAKFDNSVTGSIKLATNGIAHMSPISESGFSVVNGSSNLRVRTEDPHGLLVGSKLFVLINDDVPPGLTKSNMDNVREVVAVHNAYEFSVLMDAASTITTSFGGRWSGMVSRSLIADTIHMIAQEYIVEGTSSKWTIVGKTGKSLSGDETPYNNTDIFNIPNNADVDLPYPMYFMNVDDSMDKGFAAIATATVSLTSETDNVSPMVNINTVGLVAINNVINYPSSLVETNPFGGNAEARYSSKILGLKNAANSLKVFLDVNSRQDTDLIVMYRTGNSETETNNKNWSQLNSSGIPNASSGFDFQEVEFSVDDIAPFSFYQLKVVMLSKSSSVVPKAKRLRVIALGT